MILVAQSTNERPLGKEIEGVQSLADFAPVLLEALALSFQKKLLQGFAEFSDRFSSEIPV